MSPELELANGSVVRIFPDGAGRSIISAESNALLEAKDVLRLSRSLQFRRYAQLGEPIDLVVSTRTKSISQPLVDLIDKSGGSIRVFDTITKTFKPWIAP